MVITLATPTLVVQTEYDTFVYPLDNTASCRLDKLLATNGLVHLTHIICFTVLKNVNELINSYLIDLLRTKLG